MIEMDDREALLTEKTASLKEILLLLERMPTLGIK
jgi:hypothetical protein